MTFWHDKKSACNAEMQACPSPIAAECICCQNGWEDMVMQPFAKLLWTPVIIINYIYIATSHCETTTMTIAKTTHDIYSY